STLAVSASESGIARARVTGVSRPGASSPSPSRSTRPFAAVTWPGASRTGAMLPRLAPGRASRTSTARTRPRLDAMRAPQPGTSPDRSSFLLHDVRRAHSPRARARFVAGVYGGRLAISCLSTPPPIPWRRGGDRMTVRPLVLGCLLLGPAAHAATKASPAPPATVEPVLQGLEWRNVGPSRGGRVVAVAGVPGQPFVYYFGGTGGGVWETDDAGGSWGPISDGRLGHGSAGAL